MKKIKHGFTLIEILVVISIIGILAGIAAVAYTQVTRQARDSRRVNDLRGIQAAFEQFYNDNGGSYPTSFADLTAGGSYLPEGYPVDPKSGSSYTYAGGNIGAAGTSYYFRATLDNTQGGNSNNATCTSFAASGSLFCIKQLQ